MPGTCYLTESDDEKETTSIQATNIYATVKPSVITASINLPLQTPKALPQSSPITLKHVLTYDSHGPTGRYTHRLTRTIIGVSALMSVLSIGCILASQGVYMYIAGR